MFVSISFVILVCAVANTYGKSFCNVFHIYKFSSKFKTFVISKIFSQMQIHFRSRLETMGH